MAIPPDVHPIQWASAEMSEKKYAHLPISDCGLINAGSIRQN